MREAPLRKGALRSVPVPALYCRSTKQAGHVTGRAGRATFPQNTGDIAMQNVRRHLILYKGDELFIYGYDPGQETRVLETLIAQAKDERTDLDWFDVGVLEQKLKEVFGTRTDLSPEHLRCLLLVVTKKPNWYAAYFDGRLEDRAIMDSGRYFVACGRKP